MAQQSSAGPTGLPLSMELKKDTIDELGSYWNLLHLIHHRNNNQHRRALWYRHFSTFRRQLADMISDLVASGAGIPCKKKTIQTGADKPATARPTGTVADEMQDLLRVRRAARSVVATARHRADARWKVWAEDGKAEEWMCAFSSIVANLRFAPIGLVLVAVLARVCHLLAVTDGWIRCREAAAVATANKRLDVGSLSQQLRLEPEIDTGEVVARDLDPGQLDRSSRPSPLTAITVNQPEERPEAGLTIPPTELEDQPGDGQATRKRPRIPTRPTQDEAPEGKRKRPSKRSSKPDTPAAASPAVKKKKKKTADLDDIFAAW